MSTATRHDQRDVPIIDMRSNGLGDVVVACWILHSARAIGARVRLNPRNRRDVALVLGVDERDLTFEEAPDWSLTPGIGHQLEYALNATTPISRFDAWCESLGLPDLAPVRPSYCELSEDGDWANAQWRTVDPEGAKPRVLLFPDAAWPIRTWPKAYFIDLASQLIQAGYAVAAMSASQATVEFMPCHWWGGFKERPTAAMARRATLVIANESGPSHLAAAVGTQTLAICGPTDPSIVFAHEPNVQPVSLDAGTLPCVGCHFAPVKGYRFACDAGGCQALMRLDPATVVSEAGHLLAASARDNQLARLA